MEKVPPDRFDVLMLPYLDAAYNLARWLSNSSAEADDVVQESYLRAFRLFSSYSDDNPRAWLLAIVRNTWNTRWRQGQRHATVPIDDDTTQSDDTLSGWSEDGSNDPENIMLRQQDVALVRRAMAGLPVEFREVLVLRELEEMSYKECAATIGIPIGTVMSRLARARRMLGMAVRSDLASDNTTGLSSARSIRSTSHTLRGEAHHGE